MFINSNIFVKKITMSRPKRNRKIVNPPIMEGFKPFGIPITQLEPVILLYEEYESIRLCDYEGLTQEQASKKMGVSRPTFTRVYDKARKNIAKAFVEGKAIFIEGGNFQSDYYWYKCEDCMELTICEEPSHECKKCKNGNVRLLNKTIMK